MTAGFDDLLARIGDGVPDAAQYQALSALHLDHPAAARLSTLDPFSPAYREAALALYLSLRGRPEQGYDAVRDEPPATARPDRLSTGVVPWSFGDASLVSEHLLAWGHIFRRLALPPGGSVLEYGPGSGQILLMLARLGHRACGVDIDGEALRAIEAQAAQLDLDVETEQGEFGEGFDVERFDVVLFYEAFHHALEFESLLIRLHDRLSPGGRLILCGEPIVGLPSAAIPYPWGPRLDGLSVFCIRRFGWMELGFSHEYFVAVARATGWMPRFIPGDVGRSTIYVLQPDGAPPDRARAAASGSTAWAGTARNRQARIALRRLRARLRSLRRR